MDQFHVQARIQQVDCSRRIPENKNKSLDQQTPLDSCLLFALNEKRIDRHVFSFLLIKVK